MTIGKHRDGSALTLAPEGRLDTITSPELEKVFKESLDVCETIMEIFEVTGFLDILTIE